jgi:HD-like signal output (HDOD) protein
MALKPGTVEAILTKLSELPTLPSVATRLLSAGSTDKAEIDEITKIIETDPALTARILGLCRRSDRGLGDRVTTVKLAVVMLGIQSVCAAALAACVYETMGKDVEAERRQTDDATAAKAGSGEGVAFDQNGFWKYSIAVACASELIAGQHARLRIVPEEAFLAGLMHGVGKLALAHVLPRAYGQVLRLAQMRAIDAPAVERELLGIDHHSAGRRLAEHWGLPEHVQRVIWLHAQPDLWAATGEGPGMVKLVALARALCRHLHLGSSGDYGVPDDVTPLADAMSIRRGALDPVVGPLHAAVSDRLHVLGLDETTPPALLLESLTNANRQLALVNAAMRQRSLASQAIGVMLGAIRGIVAEASTCPSEGAAASFVIGSARRAAGLKRGGIVVARGDGVSLWCAGDTMTRPLTATASLAQELRAGKITTSSRIVLVGGVARAGGLDLDQRNSIVILLGNGTCLVGEREPGAMGDDRTLRPLAEAWGMLISTARERELSQRRAERLTESGRVLEKLQRSMPEKAGSPESIEKSQPLARAVADRLRVIEGHATMLRSRQLEAADAASVDAILAAVSIIASTNSASQATSVAAVAPATTAPPAVPAAQGAVKAA